jgi:hypothetical protein
LRDASYDDPKKAYENYVNIITQNKQKREEAKLQKLREEAIQN